MIVTYLHANITEYNNNKKKEISVKDKHLITHTFIQIYIYVYSKETNQFFLENKEI